MPKFELKKFKSQMGHEGPGFYCLLYVDGVKGAEAINQGDGGMVYWHWFDADAKRKFDEHLASLPERTIRSLAAMTGGTASLLTDTLFPDALRGTTIYRVLVGDMQRFIVEKVAQVDPSGCKAGEGPVVPDGADAQFVVRKVAGTALESAGLFAMHVSPLWVFAIASDAAAGGSVFLNRLVAQLKANGVIEPEANVAGLADLLDAVQHGAGKSVSAFDTPPMYPWTPSSPGP